jgi:hypothetical protein
MNTRNWRAVLPLNEHAQLEGLAVLPLNEHAQLEGLAVLPLNEHTQLEGLAVLPLNENTQLEGLATNLMHVSVLHALSSVFVLSCSHTPPA